MNCIAGGPPGIGRDGFITGLRGDRLVARFVLAVALVASSIVTIRGGEHTPDSLATVKERVEKEQAILIDVREEAEWRAGHLDRARFVPLSSLKTTKGLEAVVAKLPKKTPIYVHCRSGGRCLIAGELFEKHGLDVRPLKAGYDDLLKAGFEKAKAK
jgi:phage shock protein E